MNVAAECAIIQPNFEVPDKSDLKPGNPMIFTCRLEFAQIETNSTRVQLEIKLKTSVEHLRPKPGFLVRSAHVLKCADGYLSGLKAAPSGGHRNSLLRCAQSPALHLLP